MVAIASAELVYVVDVKSYLYMSDRSNPSHSRVQTLTSVRRARPSVPTGVGTLRAPSLAPVPLATPWDQTSPPVQVRAAAPVTFAIYDMKMFRFTETRAFSKAKADSY